MAVKDDFDGQMSLFGMDDMDFEGIGITGGGDLYEEEEFLTEKKAGRTKKEKSLSSEMLSVEKQEPMVSVEVDSTSEEVVKEEKSGTKKASLPKLKIEGVFQCLTCGKLLTKTVTEDKARAFCNCCNVTYTGNL